MRISDWSSDVCSSDLGRRGRLERAVLAREDGVIVSHKLRATIDQAKREIGFAAARRPFDQHRAASDRDAGGVERFRRYGRLITYLIITLIFPGRSAETARPNRRTSAGRPATRPPHPPET